MTLLKHCLICGQAFTVKKKNAKTATCSMSCGSKLAHVNRVKSLQNITVECGWEGCPRRILNRYARAYCSEHQRQVQVQRPYEMDRPEAPRPVHRPMPVLSAAMPAACYKCGGFVAREWGPLTSQDDMGWQDSYRCLNCGWTGHERCVPLAQPEPLTEVQAKVQALALTA